MKTDTVCFKSIPKFYEKEEKGLKPNTFRKPYFGINRDYDDEGRFAKLSRFERGELTSLNIEITNTETNKHFIRCIKDVSIYKNTYIISWTHPKSQEIG